MTTRVSYKGYDFEGVSEGGVRTSILFPRFDLMFDIGTLDADKSHIGKLLLSHSHLDHSALLPYYISQRSLRKLPAPEIYVPEDTIEAWGQILTSFARLEGFDYKYRLMAARPNEKYMLGNNTFFKPMESYHRVPSVGYTIYETVTKLKEEFIDLPKKEIVFRKKRGDDIFDIRDNPIVSFSGDAKIEYVMNNPDVGKSKILFLECTYIDDKCNIDRAREWGHIHLDEIIENADLLQNERIILIHFSRRYSSREILRTLKQKMPPEMYARTSCFFPS